MQNMPASLLVVSLGKALNGTPPSLCSRQVTHRTSSGYNCEVANPAGRERRLLSTFGHPPVFGVYCSVKQESPFYIRIKTAKKNCKFLEVQL